MCGSAQGVDFAEEDVFQIRRVRSKTGVERLLAINMERRAATDEAIRNDAVFLFVGGKLCLFDGAPPNFSGELCDGGVRAALIKNFSLVNDGHVGAELHYVFDDVGGENDDDAFADFGEEVVEAVAFSGIETGGRLVHDKQFRIAEKSLGDAEALT